MRTKLLTPNPSPNDQGKPISFGLSHQPTRAHTKTHTRTRNLKERIELY